MAEAGLRPRPGLQGQVLPPLSERGNRPREETRLSLQLQGSHGRASPPRGLTPSKTRDRNAVSCDLLLRRLRGAHAQPHGRALLPNSRVICLPCVCPLSTAHPVTELERMATSPSELLSPQGHRRRPGSPRAALSAAGQGGRRGCSGRESERIPCGAPGRGAVRSEL